MKRDLMTTTGLRGCDTPEPVPVIAAEDAALVELFYGDSARPYQIAGVDYVGDVGFTFSGYGHGTPPPGDWKMIGAPGEGRPIRVVYEAHGRVRLEYEEGNVVRVTSESQRLTPADIRRMLDRLDSNGDPSVTPREFDGLRPLRYGDVAVDPMTWATR